MPDATIAMTRDLELSDKEANALYWLGDDLRHVEARSTLSGYPLSPDEVRLVRKVIDAMRLEAFADLDAVRAVSADAQTAGADDAA